MQSTDLRVGNHIKFGELEHKCAPCDIENLYKAELLKQQLDTYKGIPLDEKRLLACGFEKHGVSFTKKTKIGLFCISKWSDGKYRFSNALTLESIDIDYLHTLENIFFFSTLKELLS